MQKPEIIAPGGSNSKAMVAAHNGADAIYLGVPFTSLRMRQNKLNTLEELKNTVEQIHQLGKKVYLTMNIFPRNTDIKVFESVVEQISEAGADAIIFSDLGTYKILKRYVPDVDLHLSTQTSTLNYEAVSFWHDMGVRRIVLARELNVDEIKEIRQQVPKMELEVFAHGAMCVSYSGRCLLGEYFSGRDGNKGECSHVCRYGYNIYLEEEKRPGKLFQLDEENGVSYLMSSKDLCIIERLNEVIPYVDGLKIEGRSKGEFYVAGTVKAYKYVVDSLSSGNSINEDIKNLVYKVPHRPYWEGFLLNDRKKYRPDSEYGEKEDSREEINNDSTISYTTPGPLKNGYYCGLVMPEKKEIESHNFSKVIPKDNISLEDSFKVISSDGIQDIKVKKIYQKNTPVERAHCNMEDVFIEFDKDVKGREVLYK